MTYSGDFFATSNNTLRGPHNWFIKGRGMYCSVYGKVHIKDPLLLIEKSSLCGGSGFPSKKVCQRDHMNDVQ